MTKQILYKLSWSGGDHWCYRLGLVTPDGSMGMFDDGTLFKADSPTSYASSTPEEAVASATGRMDLSIKDQEGRLKRAQDELAESRRLLDLLEKQRDELGKEGQALAECRRLVGTFFNDDVDKTRLWFKVKNPLLGDITPDDMIAMHRTEKLLRFIKGQLAENPPLLLGPK